MEACSSKRHLCAAGRWTLEDSNEREARQLLRKVDMASRCEDGEHKARYSSAVVPLLVWSVETRMLKATKLHRVRLGSATAFLDNDDTMGSNSSFLSSTQLKSR